MPWIFAFLHKVVEAQRKLAIRNRHFTGRLPALFVTGETGEFIREGNNPEKSGNLIGTIGGLLPDRMQITGQDLYKTGYVDVVLVDVVRYPDFLKKLIRTEKIMYCKSDSSLRE